MSEISKNVKSYLFPKSQTSQNNDAFEEVSEQLIHDSELITLKEEAHKEGFSKGYENGNLKGFEQGTIQGNKEGYQKGYANGEQEAHANLNDIIQVVSEIKEKLSELHIKKNKRQQQELCDLVLSIAQKVIQAELTLQPQQILKLVEETIDTMPDEHLPIQILLNPNVLNRISQIQPNIPDKWNLLPDESLDECSCKLVSESNEANINYTERLKSCINSINENLKSG